MKQVTDERLDEIIKINEELHERYKECAEIEIGYSEFICLMKELQSLRKGVEDAIEEIEYRKNFKYIETAFVKGGKVGLTIALEILKKHLPKEL